MEVRIQFAGVGFLLLPYWSLDEIAIVRLGSKRLLLNHLTGLSSTHKATRMRSFALPRPYL